jgi:hypothetical protein
MADKDTPQPPVEDEERNVSLVPLYSPLDVSKGLQAYRRGDMILYTVRGEPDKVQELLTELDGRGVGEVVALVSHRAEEPEEVQTVEPEEKSGSPNEE